jgi:hypothetical protein
VSVFSDQTHPQNIFNKFRFWERLSLCVKVSKYGAEEMEEEIWSAFKCEANLELNEKLESDVSMAAGCANYGLKKQKVFVVRKTRSGRRKYSLSFDIKTSDHNAIGCGWKHMKPVKQAYLEGPVIILYIEQRSCDMHTQESVS